LALVYVYRYAHIPCNARIRSVAFYNSYGGYYVEDEKGEFAFAGTKEGCEAFLKKTKTRSPTQRKI
jgi:hypothetical protein